MDVITAIKTRRSIRQFKAKPITKECLRDLIDAARFAPTARAVQPWEFIIITNKDTLKKIGELAENGRFVSGASSCIAVFSNDTKYYLEDCCAATENILLAATAGGIASCWVAGDKKPYCQTISALLDVPGSFKLVSLIALGYPESEKEFKVADKRSIDELIHWERY